MSKFERIAKLLKHHWGFEMWKNDPNNRGRWKSLCKSGYTVQDTVRGHKHLRFDSLEQIVRAYSLDEMTDEEKRIALSRPLKVKTKHVFPQTVRETWTNPESPHVTEDDVP